MHSEASPLLLLLMTTFPCFFCDLKHFYGRIRYSVTPNSTLERQPVKCLINHLEWLILRQTIDAYNDIIGCILCKTQAQALSLIWEGWLKGLLFGWKARSYHHLLENSIRSIWRFTQGFTSFFINIMEWLQRVLCTVLLQRCQPCSCHGAALAIRLVVLRFWNTIASWPYPWTGLCCYFIGSDKLPSLLLSLLKNCYFK